MSNSLETKPLVSVLTACFNQAQYVVECLESIRNQTYTNTELIIIDDASSDESVAVIRDWIARYSVKCKFIAHSENLGVCKTFNEALSHATGKYISMIAADDVWMLDKIEHQVAQMEQLPGDVGVLYSDVLRIDEHGNLLPQKFIEARRQFSTMPEGRIFPILLERNFIPAMSTLIRKSCYDKVGTYDENLCYEDFDMWLRISQYYRFVFSPVISAKYRVVPTSLTQTILHSRNCLKLRSDFRMYMKLLVSGRNGEVEQRAIIEHLNDMAEHLYKIKCEKRNRYFWKLLRFDPRPFTVGMFVFSVLGFSYERFMRFVADHTYRATPQEGIDLDGQPQK